MHFHWERFFLSDSLKIDWGFYYHLYTIYYHVQMKINECICTALFNMLCACSFYAYCIFTNITQGPNKQSPQLFASKCVTWCWHQFIALGSIWEACILICCSYLFECGVGCLGNGVLRHYHPLKTQINTLIQRFKWFF